MRLIKQRKFLVLVLVLVLMSGLVGCRDQELAEDIDGESVVWEAFYNDYYGIKYPAEWNKNTVASIVGFAPEEREELGFDIQMRESGSLEDFEENIEYREDEYSDLKSREEIEVDGQPAYKFIWSDEEDLNGIDILAYKNGYKIILTFVGEEEEYQNNIKIAERMLDSFEIFALEEIEEEEEEIVEGDLTSQQALEDARYLWDKLRAIHPNIYYFHSEEEAVKDFAAIEEELKARESISKRELYTILAPFAASFQEAHTQLGIWNEFDQYGREGGEVIPLLVKVKGDSLELLDLAVSDEIPVGAEIVAVNNQSSAEIINQMRELISYEEESWPEVLIEMNFARYFWALNDEQEEYLVEYKTADDELEEVALAGVSTGIYYMSQNALREDLTFGAWDLEYFDSGVSWLTLNTFGYSPALVDFIDRAFANIAGMESETLVIDIRNNGGGSPNVVAQLFEYIYDEPYSLFEKDKFRLSEEINYKQRGFYGRLSQHEILEDEIAVVSGEKNTPDTDENRFEGDVYVLTSSSSFSAASIFPDLVKEYEAGVLIGSTTGGPPNTHGGAVYNRLPNSGLDLSVSNMFFLRSETGVDDSGVSPDIELEFVDDRDELEQILEVVE